VSAPAPPLPAVLVLTDRLAAADAGHDLATIVAGCAGLDAAVILREKDLPSSERATLASKIATVAHRFRVPLIVASDRTVASMIAAQGVHLAANDPSVPTSRGWVGRSCHDELDMTRAATEGLHYVTLSPVFETPSKPGYGPILGIDGLCRLVERVTLPVYALAGITAVRVSACVAAGAHGIAVQGSVMAAADPAGEIRAMVAAVHDARAVGPRR
jgi:thiamine-phosphate pyrophosphorylase